jgi:hypothetical protein
MQVTSTNHFSCLLKVGSAPVLFALLLLIYMQTSSQFPAVELSQPVAYGLDLFPLQTLD